VSAFDAHEFKEYLVDVVRSNELWALGSSREFSAIQLLFDRIKSCVNISIHIIMDHRD
jgi:hypothetical protein